MVPWTINEGGVGDKSIREILTGKRSTVQHGLQIFGGTFPDHIPANDAACLPVNIGYDVDFVFLSPIKVNNSSNSLTSSSIASDCGGWLGRLSAWRLSQFATL